MAAVRNAETLERLCTLLEQNAGDVARACADVGVSTGWLKRWGREDPKIEAAIKDAIDTGAAVLESAMLKRAVDGVQEPVFYKDNIVGHKTKYSDSLLMFALESRKRDTYGKRVDMNHNVNVKHLSDDELDQRIGLLADRLGVNLALPAPSMIDAVDADFSEIEPELSLEDLL